MPWQNALRKKQNNGGFQIKRSKYDNNGARKPLSALIITRERERERERERGDEDHGDGGAEDGDDDTLP